MTAAVDGAQESSGGVDASALLAALDDAHCQGLLGVLASADEPLTVGAVVERCDVAESTAYRKLGRLQDVGVVAKHERLRNDGRCAGYFALRADGITVDFDDGDVTAAIRHAEG